MAWVRAQVRSCEICGRESGTAAGFLQVLQFPLPITVPAAPHSSSKANTIGQIAVQVPSGLSLTPPQGNVTMTYITQKHTVLHVM
jgi:hypothetical protein